MGDYSHADAVTASQAAFEPFFFCETLEENVPLGREAWTLDEFHDALKDLAHGSLQFHFITSRLRLHLRTNDFSRWLARDLGLIELGRKVDQIDIYTATLDSARSTILHLVERELYQ